MVGWWSAGNDLIKGEALIDGVANPNMDRAIRATGYNVCEGDYEVALDASKLKVKFTNGPPGHTEKVYWQCTTVSGGCHNPFCGSVFMGQFTLDATGFGVFKKIIPGGNPFPGKFAFIEAGSGAVGEVFTSTFGEVPAGAAPVAAEAEAGDPVQ
jgi:hypothetical protein